MNPRHLPAASTAFRLAWMVLFGLAIVLALMAAYILAVPVDATDFETTTGVDWASFSSANPEVAAYLNREARLLAVGLVGLPLLVAAITWSRLRAGDRWAAGALWFFPATLWALAVVFFTGNGAGLGVMYAAAGVVAAVAVLGAHRALAARTPHAAGLTERPNVL